MKIAVQQRLLPGAAPADQLKWAADHGVEGIELIARNYPRAAHDQALREFEKSPVPVCAICGNLSFDFLDPDPKKRRQSIQESKEALELCGKLGAVGQIVPPIFGPPRLNDLTPLKDAVALEKDLLVEICKELGDHAAAHKTMLLLEPLNRYEQHLLRKQEQGVEIIERCGHPAVGLISDFFHMHIEETNSPAALRAAGKHVKHVHLADNTRLEPGTGDIDFLANFRALAEIGFTGYLSYECSIGSEDKELALKKSLEFVRNAINKAKAS
ncbi:MAG: sugar phosphate isomerase/epimerase [Planctomycetes bacterium]|nr:sugar phosphate isomerase/epimerase [Planctomycetota bacterium]